MKYARCATVSATFTLCSTSTTVVPDAARRSTIGKSWPTTTGARPSDNSSISRMRGLAMKLIASASICCWPPDRSACGVVETLAEDGEHLHHLGGGRRHAVGVAVTGPAGQLQVLADGQRAEDALTTGHLGDPERGDLVRWCMRDLTTVEHDRPAIGLDDAADRLQERRLAGAVRAEQRHDLALDEFHVDAVQHAPAGVPGLDTAEQEQRALALAALVEQFGAGGGRAPHLGDVALDHLGDAAQDDAADDEHREHDEHPDPDRPLVGDPADQWQDRQAGITQREATRTRWRGHGAGSRARGRRRCPASASPTCPRRRS